MQHEMPLRHSQTQKWQTNEGYSGKMGTWRGDSTLEPAWENSHWPNSHWEECDLQEKWSRKWVPTTVAGLSEARGRRKQRGSFSVSVHVRLTLSLTGLRTAKDSSKSCSLPSWPTAQLNILVTHMLCGQGAMSLEEMYLTLDIKVLDPNHIFYKLASCSDFILILKFF